MHNSIKCVMLVSLSLIKCFFRVYWGTLLPRNTAVKCTKQRTHKISSEEHHMVVYLILIKSLANIIFNVHLSAMRQRILTSVKYSYIYLSLHCWGERTLSYYYSFRILYMRVFVLCIQILGRRVLIFINITINIQ